MPEQDTALLTRIAERDPDALGEYIQANRWRLMAFIEGNLGPALRRKVEPDDIFQEMSADAVRSLRDIDLAGRDPFSWLCQIADRVTKDAHRWFFVAQKRNAALETPLAIQPDNSSGAGLLDLLAASYTTPSQEFRRNARESQLLNAVARLPADHRRALRMRYYEQLPSKQIAAKLGKTDVAVRVMLTRSLKKLQEILADQDSLE